ncbi:Uncharacterized protein KF715C_pA3190 (plasmid) [Pseudomonas putida]|uniref:Uncharacterized protein n=1 Tax=Pseudomonas putida TaxID=303 RepID=A0A1L7NN07_PSEPU|nr:Uncharacterized protein KF715C_pA3190 [Pseudomonas putida]
MSLSLCKQGVLLSDINDRGVVLKYSEVISLRIGQQVMSAENLNSRNHMGDTL